MTVSVGLSYLPTRTDKETELSKDSVDSLRKKVEGRQKKIEAAKAGQRPGWEVEVDKLVACK